MKQFSLDEYLKNPSKRIVTRTGLPVRIICTDADNEQCVLGLVRLKIGEVVFEYYRDGTHSYKSYSDWDLFFASEKKEGWVNVYKSAEFYYFGGINPYPSKSEAISHIMKNDDYVRTVKIEWEE